MYPEGSAYPLRTLFDAAVRQYSIKLTCRACRHVRILHPHALWWMFDKKGWPDSFRDVQRRAVCVPCRKLRGEIVRSPRLELVHEEITGEPLPLPSKQEWKRALSRHR
ncbi:hypothetical protein [Sphingosinicella sp. LY1275]|uniref:hypothetical protein n=1 Tax=Sphingosinicella sp. LY1275 TaxID=3095379 RepID=UPI002ADED140|nr:hypothetical protein [Sphingosinicella sp. LY1275]MEA1015329.1 hypothetical protein [Sphingosinicella sp. LY1275]